MPYLKEYWRLKKGLIWISKILCSLGYHAWFYSNIDHLPLKCATCGRTTKHLNNHDI